MRDPNRIVDVLVLLAEYWTMEPDLRLGQIISNATYFSVPSLHGDPFNLEDDKLLVALTKMIDDEQERRRNHGDSSDRQGRSA